MHLLDRERKSERKIIEREKMKMGSEEKESLIKCKEKKPKKPKPDKRAVRENAACNLVS